MTNAAQKKTNTVFAKFMLIPSPSPHYAQKKALTDVGLDAHERLHCVSHVTETTLSLFVLFILQPDYTISI